MCIPTTAKPIGGFPLPVSADTLCVPPDRIGEIWPYVERWLANAVAKCGDWTVAALLDGLRAEQMLLWVRWDGEVLRAAAVTQLVIVPRGKICTVIACGGERVGSWKAALAPIETYAKEQACVAMRIQGRVAWSKVFDDYELEWVTLEKGLN